MAFGNGQGKPLIRYVTKNLSDGWLAVRPEHGPNISLPSFLKVGVYKEEPDRSYFTILEGLNKGVKASVAHITGKAFLVETGCMRRPESCASTVPSNTSGTDRTGHSSPSREHMRITPLSRAACITCASLTLHTNPTATPRTRPSRTWFPIIGNGVVAGDGRYLHIGELSDGCVTVRAFVFDPKNPPSGPLFQDWANLPPDVLGAWGLPYPKSPLAPLASWTEIYKYLIDSRLDDLFIRRHPGGGMIAKKLQCCGMSSLFTLIMLTGSCGGQQATEGSKSAACAPLQHRFDSVLRDLSHETSLEQRSSLLHFIQSVPDDPENCVTRSAEEKLVQLEEPMFQLKFDQVLIPPDWLYQCHAIDRKTQHCSGAAPYDDDIPHAPNETLMTPHMLPPRGRAATIDIVPGVGCKVETISMLEATTPNHVSPPKMLSPHGGTFPLEPLRHMRSPVLIAAIRCDDTLRFRKAAWLLK